MEHQKLGSGIDHQFLRAAVNLGKDGRPSIAGAQLGSHSAGGRRSVQH